jgi:DNA repair exonuclease SbcCD ATPase subunit
MSTGLKKELGLGDPKSPTVNQGSTEQADKFKAAYQASSGKINESLQYTAAYAQKSKHDPLSAKRDTLCQAYQVALQRIDPTKPAVAQGAIDQVLASAKQLQASSESLKAAAEKAYNAWTARQGDLEKVTDQVREMVEWGHEKAAPLQQVLDAINGKANERAYEEALKGLEQLLSKAEPIYADYQKQKAAQEDYDPARQAVQAKLDEAQNCPFKSLETAKQEISAGVGPMEQAATAKNYVDALAQLRTLETKATEFQAKVVELEAKKQVYETARGTLDPKLTEASKCQFKSLAELDQKIADLTTKTDTAATDEKYDEAVTSVGELTTAVDEKVQKAEELEEKKKQYEEARKALDPKLTEASQCKFKALAELDQKIADLTTKTDTAATDEKYDEALTAVGELTKAVEEKLQKTKELEEKKAAYEKARGSLDPKLAQASTCKHEELAKLDEEIAKMSGDLDKAAADEDYAKALEIANQLSAKCDTKLSEEARIDRKVIGSAQKERADKKLESLDEASRKRFNDLSNNAKTPEERDYLSKALAANYSIDEIEAFAKKINGKDKDWLQNNLKLTGNTDGKGVKQQWSHSCNATTTQALRGELDPLYSLKLHEENKDITKADNADGTKENPKLADEQKKALESEYSGKAAGKHSGVAASRDDPTGTGSGRWADDLMNKSSDVTGVEYANQKIGTSYKVDDAVTDIDSGLKKGHPVPIVIGNSSTAYTHYVLVTGRDDGPPATFTIHDPWDGVTVKRSVQDVKDGKINLAGSNQISALEKPSTKEDKKKK